MAENHNTKRLPRLATTTLLAMCMNHTSLVHYSPNEPAFFLNSHLDNHFCFHLALYELKRVLCIVVSRVLQGFLSKRTRDRFLTVVNAFLRKTCHEFHNIYSFFIHILN